MFAPLEIVPLACGFFAAMLVMISFGCSFGGQAQLVGSAPEGCGHAVGGVLAERGARLAGVVDAQVRDERGWQCQHEPRSFAGR